METQLILPETVPKESTFIMEPEFQILPQSSMEDFILHQTEELVLEYTLHHNKLPIL